MNTIWKYALKHDSQKIAMQKGARILSVHTQDGYPTMWVECLGHFEPDTPSEERIFYTVGTGGQVPESTKFVGTTHHNGFVWHIYERV